MIGNRHRQRASPVAVQVIGHVAVCVCLLMTCLLDGVCAADLDFPQRHLQATPAPGAKTVEFAFPFTNQGTSPVTITDIQVGCNCVVAQLEQKTFAPEERGVIPVTYTIGSAFGVQQKAIQVISTDQDHPVIVLVVEVKLPEGPTITPKFLHWVQHAPADSKSVEISIPADATWNIVGVYDNKDHFTVALVPGEKESRKMTLLVTPQQTGRPATGVIVLETDGGMVFHVFAQVRPAAQEQAP